jgi:putative transposase
LLTDKNKTKEDLLNTKEETMASGKIIQIDEHLVQSQIKDVIKGTIEETLNIMLDAEADQLCNAGRYERSVEREDTRAGHYKRNLDTTAGRVALKVPKLRNLPFETAIIERYKRRETSVEESLKESYPYVYLDGIVLKRSWAGEVKNVSVLVAIGVSESGFREIIGVAEGAKEDKEGWSNFLKYLKSRGLRKAELFITDKCFGLVESLTEHFPQSRWQRCVVHFYRNVFTMVPRGKIREVAAMLKAIHAQEDRDEALKKARSVTKKLDKMKLKKASKMIADSIHETLEYMYFPERHWIRIRTNNPLERISVARRFMP